MEKLLKLPEFMYLKLIHILRPKPAYYLFVFISTTLIFQGCLKDPNHSIRIKNDYPLTVKNVSIGSIGYGSIGNGVTSDYKHVNEGTSDVSGTTAAGQTLSGEVYVKGMGNHKWTLTILSSGKLSIKED